MKIAIKDANIFFDLLEMDLIDEFLSLNYSFLTSDFVQSEIKSEKAKSKFESITKKGLIKIESLSFEEMTEAYKLKELKAGLSMPDCSVIYLAQKHDAILLSGDKPVRLAAKSVGLEYHGVLWALDEMIKQSIIPKKTAKIKLQQLMLTNNRLPKSECKKRLERW
jgi:predicted nucleic acid-binding protein